MDNIMVKSSFTGWHKIGEKEALRHASWKFQNITMGSEQYRIRIINDRFDGISFTLDQLQGVKI